MTTEWYFSETFIITLIISALVLISIAVITLIVFFIRDIKSKEVW